MRLVKMKIFVVFYFGKKVGKEVFLDISGSFKLGEFRWRIIW